MPRVSCGFFPHSSSLSREATRRWRRVRVWDSTHLRYDGPIVGSAGQAIVEVKLTGHLTEQALGDVLSRTKPPQGAGMIFDCLEMTGYDLAARHAFVAWHREQSARVVAV